MFLAEYSCAGVSRASSFVIYESKIVPVSADQQTDIGGTGSKDSTPQISRYPALLNGAGSSRGPAMLAGPAVFRSACPSISYICFLAIQCGCAPEASNAI